MNKATLVLGVPGSGKTYISTQLAQKEINAYDADELNGLCKWVDKEGKRVVFPKDATKEWLGSHSYIWDRNFLKSWLDENCSAILFGISSNAWDVFDLFDRVVYLYVGKDELRRRLDDPSRKNPMGKTEEQKQSIFDNMEKNRKKAESLGAVVADATLSPDEIFKRYIESK